MASSLVDRETARAPAPIAIATASQGNAQTTGDGDLFVGWGALPYVSEFDPTGRLIFNAEFPAGVNTYRAYSEPYWPATKRATSALVRTPWVTPTHASATRTIAG